MNLWTHLAACSFIETEHAFLRPIVFEDAGALYKIASNPENTQFIFPTEASLEESEYVIANFFMKNPLGIWAICHKETQEMIGSVKFEKMDEIKKEAELGYFLRKDYWGQGMMTEIMYEIPSDEDIAEVEITKDVVENQAKPRVERNPEKRQERWLEFQQNKEDNVKERKQLKKRG